LPSSSINEDGRETADLSCAVPVTSTPVEWPWLSVAARVPLYVPTDVGAKVTLTVIAPPDSTVWMSPVLAENGASTDTRLTTTCASPRLTSFTASERGTPSEVSGNTTIGASN
jgi:hypothetical protein